MAAKAGTQATRSGDARQVFPDGALHITCAREEHTWCASSRECTARHNPARVRNTRGVLPHVNAPPATGAHWARTVNDSGMGVPPRCAG